MLEKETNIPKRLTYADILTKLNDRILTFEKIVQYYQSTKKGHNTNLQPPLPESGLTPEEIIFVIQSKFESGKRKGNYLPYILIDNQSSFDNLQTTLNEYVQKGKAFNHYIVMNFITGKSGRHSTPLRIDYDGKDIKFPFIDTLAFSQNMIMIFRLYNNIGIDKNEVIHYTPKRNENGKLEDYLQKDSISCSIFAIQDLNTLSKIKREELSQHLTMDLSDLHPRFIKNSQNLRAINKNQTTRHQNTIVSKGKNLSQYLEDFLVIHNNITTDSNTPKIKNFAIFSKTLKYLKSAKYTLQCTYFEGGEESVQKVISQTAGVDIFRFPKYYTNVGTLNVTRHNCRSNSVIGYVNETKDKSYVNMELQRRNISNSLGTLVDI